MIKNEHFFSYRNDENQWGEGISLSNAILLVFLGSTIFFLTKFLFVFLNNIYTEKQFNNGLV